MYEYIFIALCILVPVFFLIGTKGLGKPLFIYFLWNIILMLLSHLGFFKNTQSLPPRMALVIIPAVIFIWHCYRHQAKVLINYRAHLALHTLRLPVEIVLYGIYLNKLVPKEMTYAGWNWDILSGASAIALLLVVLFGRTIPKTLFLYWNAICLTLLCIVVLVAILSAPSPIQVLAKENPNLAVLQFPYTLLPSLIVPLVFLSHLLLLKFPIKVETLTLYN